MRSPINNPFRDLENYHCFGCSPHNASGLQMTFHSEGDEVVSDWIPHERFSGYGDILHGGIQAALHDEIASWVVFVRLGTAGFTTDLSLRYLNRASVDKPVQIRAVLEGTEGNKATIVSRLLQGDTVCSESRASYFTLPAHIARKKLKFPESVGAFLVQG